MPRLWRCQRYARQRAKNLLDARSDELRASLAAQMPRYAKLVSCARVVFQFVKRRIVRCLFSDIPRH